MKNQLLSKIHDHSAVVAVIGLGYVGLPLAVAFAEKGFPVVGIDVDGHKVDALKCGESYVKDISSKRLKPLTLNPHWQGAIAPGQLFATPDFGILTRCDAAIIAVPTPLSKTRDPDMKYVLAAGKSVAQFVHPGMVVVLESTTYPGTTEELLLPILTGAEGYEPESTRAEPVSQSRGALVPGHDFFLAFSPERIDPGNKHWVVENTPKVVGGTTPACREVAEALYGEIIEQIVPVSSTQAAEMVKLLENTFRAVNIALVNEIAVMCDRLGLDPWEVIDAAATKPYGFMKFTPGPGVGGHCIPLDPYYLSWKLKTLNYNARFIQLAGEINSEMPNYWVSKVQDALNGAGKPLKGSVVLLLGVGYKKDIDDVRESPALDMIELLRAKGADVRYHDPYVPAVFHNGYAIQGEPDLDVALAAADCVVVVTDHSSYDWAVIRQKARLVVDTRNAMPQPIERTT